MLRSRRLGLLAGALALLLGACAYQGPESRSNLVTQRATWFSYLASNDIRATCVAGAPERYRLVYNADFNRQVRAYDVVREPGSWVLRQAIDRGVVFDGHLSGLSSLGAPRTAQTRLTDGEMAELTARLADAGAFGRPAVGLTLGAQDYYWLASGCHDGEFFLTGWRHPGTDIASLPFVPFIAAHDTTGVPFPPIRPGDRSCTRGLSDRDDVICFSVRIGEDGLAGY